MGTRQKRRASLLALLLLLSLLLSGCWDRKEVEDMGFVLALGVDRGPDGQVVLTAQIAVPRAIAGGGGGTGGGGGGGGGDAPPVVVEKVEQRTFFEGIRDLETFTNRRISLVHLREVIFGREMAQSGLFEAMGVLTRLRELRQTVMLMMAEGTAEEILRLHPVMERDPSLYLEDLTRRAFERTGRAPRVNLHRFLSAYESSAQQPVMPIVHSRVSKSSLVGKPHETKAQMEGAAVFRKDKLVCTLTPKETEVFLMLNRDIRSFVTEVPNPERPSFPIVVQVTSESRQVKTDVTGPNPSFQIDIRTEAEVRDAAGFSHSLATPQGVAMLGTQVGKELTRQSNGLVQKLQTECKSDALALGKHLKVRFIDFPTWSQYDWTSRFPQSKVAVSVETFIRRVGMTLESPVAR